MRRHAEPSLHARVQTQAAVKALALVRHLVKATGVVIVSAAAREVFRVKVAILELELHHALQRTRAKDLVLEVVMRLAVMQPRVRGVAQDSGLPLALAQVHVKEIIQD